MEPIDPGSKEKKKGRKKEGRRETRFLLAVTLPAEKREYLLLNERVGKVDDEG